jgi:predicted DNA-binding ArsR family transcriptional regulator
VEHYMGVLEKRALVRLEAMEILQAYAQDPVYGGNYESFYDDYKKSVTLTVEALGALVHHPSLRDDQVRRGEEALARILERAEGKLQLGSVFSGTEVQAK